MLTGTPLRYRILLLVLSPLITAHLLYTAYRHGDGRRYLKQRMGIGYKTKLSRVVWLHGASVGEINAAIPLLDLLFIEYPQIQWLITTNTTTGARLVEQKLGNRVVHCYLPMDFRSSVKHFIQHFKPCCGLIMETELWPNLYETCNENNIPLAIINARLSKKTLNMPRWLHSTAKFCVSCIDTLLVRGSLDKTGFLQLGADPAKLHVIGNIKYARTGHTGDVKGINLTRPFILAASTHANEEAMLVKIWKSLNLSSHLLVIAPRYPDRRQSILAEIERTGLRTALHSRADPVTEDTDIYLVDTLGELAAFMATAQFVFMGGSLVPRGGQNVLEPAAMGKAIITGPECFTFAEDIEALAKTDAIICVSDTEELKDTFKNLLQDSDRVQQLGKNALRFITERADIAERYLNAIKKLGWLENKRATTENTE